MVSEDQKHRYEIVNVRPGYVIVEHDLFSRAVRSYFSTEPVPPREEYREGARTWRATGMGQTFQFDIRDNESNSTVELHELLGLLYYGCSEPETPLHMVGSLAHENKISVYVAVTFEDPDKGPTLLAREKLRILNQAFNEKLQSKEKKILILPDVFGLQRTLSFGRIMIDFGLTSMEDEG